MSSLHSSFLSTFDFRPLTQHELTMTALDAINTDELEAMNRLEMPDFEENLNSVLKVRDG